MHALTRAIKHMDTGLLADVLFNIDLAPGQQQIAREIAYDLHPRTIISACTQYGKSKAVAVGGLLYTLFNTGKTIVLIAPLNDQTTIIRDYMSEGMLTCPLFRELIPNRLTGANRLQNEFNKRRIKLRDNRRIYTFSAEGKADRLMGWGGDKIVVDETGLVDSEVYRVKITRMLSEAEGQQKQLVELMNPWDKNGHAYQHWTDPAFHKIHIPWQQAVKEGRIKQEFVDQQRQTLSPIEFKILYDSVFPDDTEDTLNRWEWIEAANKNKIIPEEGFKIEYGLDVAEMGRDLTVLKKIGRDGPRIQELGTWHWGKMDIMPMIGQVTKILGEDKDSPVKVDATGVGSGAYSRLKELGYNAIKVKGGSAPSLKRDRDRFEHLKDQVHWNLREYLERGEIGLQDQGETTSQLNALKYEITSNGKIRVVKPEDKSPDYADALSIAVYRASTGIALGGDANVLFKADSQ